ncbi:hypothetical protein ACXWQB_09310, partial [Streptococcus pyogenes]
EVAKEAVTMGDTAGFLIDSVIERVPNVLKDHLLCRYDTWEEFKRDIHAVPLHKIKREKEKLVLDQSRDKEIASMRTQHALTSSALQSALHQL